MDIILFPNSRWVRLQAVQQELQASQNRLANLMQEAEQKIKFLEQKGYLKT